MHPKRPVRFGLRFSLTLYFGLHCAAAHYLEQVHCGSGRSGAALEMSTAFAAGDASSVPSKGTLSNFADIPQYPGEDVHAHAATQYKEAMDARLAGRGLLVVANGGQPNAAKSIVDIDLTRLPPLPETHRDYSRRQEARIKIEYFLFCKLKFY